MFREVFRFELRQQLAELVNALLSAYIDTLQSDLVVARAYQVEIDALGPQARARRRDSLRLFANHIREVASSLGF